LKLFFIILSDEVWEEFLPNGLLALLREKTKDFWEGPEFPQTFPDELLLLEDILLFRGTPDSPDLVFDSDLLLLVVAALIMCAF
jgi:hypothetical protein